MAVTVLGNGRSYTFSAVNEAISFQPMMPKKLIGLSFQGTGLTVAQRLTVRDTGTVGSGNILADHVVGTVQESADLWGGRTPQVVAGIAIDNNTVAGTWLVVATFEA